MSPSVEAPANPRSTRLDKAALQRIGEQVAAELEQQGGEQGALQFAGVVAEQLGTDDPNGRWVTFWYHPGVVPDGPSYVFVSSGLVERTVPLLLADRSIASVQIVVLASGSVPIGPEAAVTVRFDREQMQATDWYAISKASDVKGVLQLFRQSSAYWIDRDHWREFVDGANAGWPTPKQFPQRK